MTSPRYIIVSPVKDEEKYVELTIKSVIGQTIKPIQWIIVDDGSRDRTPNIISRYIDAYPFMQLHLNPHGGKRKLAFAEVRAFNWGQQLINSFDYEFIVKLDFDLSFPADYFEQLFLRFEADEHLGIASGVYFEQDRNGAWKEVIMPYYHAAGASKVVRKNCFEEIGGFVPAPGWDTVDEIRAMHRGWNTSHFRELRIKHHKREGSSIGSLRTSLMQGEAYYRSGGSKFFFILKMLHRLASRPFLLGSIALSWGYFGAMLERKPLLVSDAEARCYKELLMRRLRSRA